MPALPLDDGQNLGYLDIGQGRPLVLLHGFGMRAAQWRWLLPGLGRQLRLILPDLRGFGSSHAAQWRDADVLGEAAADLHRLLAHLHLPRPPVLAGLSMGACVSMRYLGDYGDGAIAGYINIDQAPRVRNDRHWRWGLFGSEQARWFERLQGVAQRIAALGERGADYRRLPRPLRRELDRMMAGFFGRAFDSRLLAASTALGMKSPLLGPWLLPRRNLRPLLDTMRAYAAHEYDFRDGLARVRVPVAAMVGLRSRMYPPEGQLRIRHSVPQARILPFAQAGHALPFEAPLHFRRALLHAVAQM